MHRQTSEWSVRMLADLKGRISTDAEYQRGIVWSEPQQALLIDSILRGYDIPKIFLQRLPDGSPNLFNVVDGVQRLTSIWRFLANEFPIAPSQAFSEEENATLVGKTWDELPQSTKDKVQFSKITVTEIEEARDEDIGELFQRLQKGEPLNAAERRNALTGEVRHFVATTLSQHPFWAATGIKDKRYSWAELSAIVLALVKANGPTGIKGADLLALYHDTTFTSNGDIANTTIQILNTLLEIANVQRGALRTRWSIVDLTVLILQLTNEGPRPAKPNQFMNFFLEFEAERREAATALSDFRSAMLDKLTLDEEQLELPHIKPDMFAYVNAFTREGATKDNITIRAEVLISRLRHFLK